MSMPPEQPQEPTAPPTAPMQPVPQQPYSSAPPPPPPPPPYSSTPPAPPAAPYYPAAEYTAPAQYQAGPVGMGDALVLPPGSSFSGWLTKVQEVARRSWKSALIIVTIGIAGPHAVVVLLGAIAGWGGTFSVTNMGSFTAAIGAAFFGAFVSLILYIAAAYVAAAGWAAGTWALVQEAATGRPANVSQAFTYGFKRAMALFPWTVVAGAAFYIGSACLFLPGVYVMFAFSMFGFVAIFERGVNPIGRSFQLTHNSATIGSTAARIGVLLLAYFIYTGIVGVIFGAISIGVAIATPGSFGFSGFGYGFIQAISAIIAAPAIALLLLGLLPTYAELRARENGGASTAQLQQQLGA